MCPFCVPPFVCPQIFLLCVSVSILHEVCTVHGSTIEVSAQKAIDVIGASLAGEPSMYMIFEISTGSYLLTALPCFQKIFSYHILLLASYHYSLLLHFPWTHDQLPYAQLSTFPDGHFRTGEN